MIYSKQKNFLFIHVPKTAGTSIRSVLEPYGGKPGFLNFTARRLEKFPALCNTTGLNNARTYDAHTTYKKIATVIPAKQLEKTFVFAFVRHPFDRLYSFYFHVLANSHHPWHEKVLGYGSFNGLIKNLEKIQEPSQRYYLTDVDDNIAVNFIGRFENINADFKIVCNRLEIPFNLPKKNVTKHDEWKNAFTKEDRQHAYTFYKEDFEAFNYDPDEH